MENSLTKSVSQIAIEYNQCSVCKLIFELGFQARNELMSCTFPSNVLSDTAFTGFLDLSLSLYCIYNVRDTIRIYHLFPLWSSFHLNHPHGNIVCKLILLATLVDFSFVYSK